MTRASLPETTASFRMRGFERLGDPHVWGTTIGAAVAYAWFVFIAPRVFDETEPPAPRAGLIYLSSVVGLNFLPFASAFRTPVFKVLGSAMATLGTAGIVLGWALNDSSAAAAAVVSDIVMLVVIAADAAVTRGYRR